MKPTDIAILDEVLGGLARDLPLVLVGPPGSGRTVLSLQLVGAAVARGETAVVLSSERPELLLRQAESLGLPLERAVSRGRLVLLELDPLAASSLRVHGSEKLVEAIRAEVAEPDLLVVESISTLTRELFDEGRVRDLLRALFGLNAAQGGLAVVTADAAQLRQEPGLERALADMSGYLVRLEREADGRRSLNIEKSRAGAPTASAVPFEIAEGGLRRLASAPGQPRADGRKARVLVATAAEGDGDRVEAVLGERYELLRANNGFRAMSQVLSDEPDAIVLEMELPRISGPEVMRSLQAAGSTIPILAISRNMGRTLDRVRALYLGAADVQTTPLNAVELSHKLETLLSLPGGPPQRPHAEGAEALLAQSNRARVVDEEEFSARISRVQVLAQRHELDSSVLMLEAPDAESGRQALTVAVEVMREEDSIFPLDERRLITLLVLTPETSYQNFLSRLAERLRRLDVSCQGFSWEVQSVGLACAVNDWKELFAEMRPWSEATGR